MPIFGSNLFYFTSNKKNAPISSASGASFSPWRSYNIFPLNLYTAWLRFRLRHEKCPDHVGLILDGNRRFAASQKLEKAWMGHAIGARKVEKVIEWLRLTGVRVVSIWVFSLENFHRTPEEVAVLMQLFESEIANLAKSPKLEQHGICVRAFGVLEALPPQLCQALKKIEADTQHHKNFFLNIGIAYSGQQEIVHAVQTWLNTQAQKPNPPSLKAAAAALSPETLSQHLYNAKLPNPDLIIRTSGEQRTSGFLLWQSAYAEYYFCPANWPEFQEHQLLKALLAYAKRQRRFGC